MPERLSGNEAAGMKTAETVHLAFDDTGHGDPAIVLIHSLFTDRTYHADLVPRLTPRHRVLNLDLRGHGGSDRPDGRYTIDALTDDVARLCDEASVSRAIFCGTSIAVALRLAARRPDLAAGVVLLDGALLPVLPAREGIGQLADAMDGPGWRDALAGFFVPRAAGAADRVRTDLAAAPAGTAAMAQSLFRDIVASAETLQEQELAGLRCPLLYLHGVFPIDVERLRRARPDVIFEAIPEAGHWAALTAPARVAEAIERFCEQAS
jgi:pimeloyl-ACP methyl ester carboxylesterase